MEATDMAVVVSQSQSELDDFRKKGLDIAPHRRRIVREDLEQKFKDENDPLRIVFVCAMWITGFNVPSLSTLYLDKPMRNHTLMQTIARANRVFHDKVNGLVVDYVGVFRDLQKALAIYGSATGGAVKEGELPVRDKRELLAALKGKLAETEAFCKEHGIDTQAILAAQEFKRMSLIQDAVDAFVANDEIKKQYLGLAATVARLYKAILPDTSVNGQSALVALFVVIAREMRLLEPQTDISDIMDDIQKLMDVSVATKGYVIREAGTPYDPTSQIDLSQIDFAALKAHFEHTHKHTEAEKLRGAISGKLKRMVQLNKSRTNYQERFQQLIDDYNSGGVNVELFFDKLLALAQELNTEEHRHIAEQLSEEELAMFDLLTWPDMGLSQKEKDEVKAVVRTLLETLKREGLVLDWRKKQRERAQVLLIVQKVLDEGLPRSYTPEIYQQKCDELYQHIYDSYYGQGRSVYAMAS